MSEAICMHQQLAYLYDNKEYEKYEIDKTRMDSRGNVEIQSYVVLAAGYSLKSGKLNIPLNIFVIPSKTSTRYGFSFGFNIRK